MKHLKISINQLKLESMERLSTEEKQTIVRKLLAHGLSYRDIEKRTSLKIATMHHWINGRPEEIKTHLQLAIVVKKLRDFQPNTAIEFMMLEQIKKIVTDKLKCQK